MTTNNNHNDNNNTNPTFTILMLMMFDGNDDAVVNDTNNSKLSNEDQIFRHLHHQTNQIDSFAQKILQDCALSAPTLLGVKTVVVDENFRPIHIKYCILRKMEQRRACKVSDSKCSNGFKMYV